MADFYVKSGAGALARTNSAVVALVDKMVIARADTTANYLVARKWVWECTTAGTTGAAVPTWPSAVTQDTTTVTDGTVVWTARKPGFSSGTTANWTFAAIYSDYTSTATAAGDTIYVSNNHAESIAGAITLAFPGTNALPTRVLCVSDLAAPPTAMATSGVIKTSGDFNLTVNGSVYIDGLTLIAGDASTGTSWMLLGNTARHQHFANCSLQAMTTENSGGGRIGLGSISGGSQSEYTSILLENCTIKTNSVSTYLYCGNGKVEYRGGSFLSGSATPSPLWNRLDGGAVIMFDGVDFSTLASTLNLSAANGNSGFNIIYRNCKLPASWSGTISAPDRPFTFVNLYNCDSADTNYRLHTSAYEGTVKSETTIVKTSGASNGTTALSWKMDTTANAEYPIMLLTSPEIAFWNDTTAAAKTLTVDIIHDSLTNLKDDEIWLEVVYLGTSGFPLGSYIHDSKASVLATAADQTASTATWTTTGLTNPNKQKLAVTFTPQEKGYYLARVKMAKASTTIYVDPLIVVT